MDTCTVSTLSRRVSVPTEGEKQAQNEHKKEQNIGLILPIKVSKVSKCPVVL
jgi:hypothetical protein